MQLSFDAERHEYRTADGVLVPNVTSILSGAGLIDSQWFTDYARTRGQAVHLATALYDRGELDESSVDERIRGYVDAWKLFRDQSGFEPEMIEGLVGNENPMYAGTLDRAGTINYTTAILDIKTGHMPAWAALQTAAYQKCKPQYRTRYGVELREDGTYRMTQFTDRNDWNVFAGALALVNWKHNNGVKST